MPLVENSPSAPPAANPYRLIPMVKTLNKVPNTAKIITDMKLSKKAWSYRARAESRMIGGSRMLKNKLAVNLGNGCWDLSSTFSISSRIT